MRLGVSMIKVSCHMYCLKCVGSKVVLLYWPSSLGEEDFVYGRSFGFNGKPGINTPFCCLLEL